MAFTRAERTSIDAPVPRSGFCITVPRDLAYTSTGAAFARCTMQPVGKRADRPPKRRIIMAFSSRVLIVTAALGLGVAASTTMAQETGTAPAAASSSMGRMHQGMMQGNMHQQGMMQGNMHQQGMMQGNMHQQGMMHGNMHHQDNGSMHNMPATVTSVDASTGKVGVNAGGMALTVHFPPKSVAGLKVGDKITLRMGYTK